MKLTSKKIAVVLAVIIMLSGSALSGCGSSDAGNSQQNDQTGSISTDSATSTSADTTGDAGGQSTSQATTATSPESTPVSAPTEVSGLTLIPSAVTAQQSFSDDSVSVAFYLQGYGAFTIQEKIGGSWQTKKENVAYQGAGGLEAGTIPAGGDSITLRLLKIENGQYTAVTREITVKRADVVAAGGIKTYQN